MAVLTTPRGRQPAILDPYIYWAELQTLIPSRNMPALKDGGVMPAGWNLVYDSANGAALTIRNPVVPIPGDKHGRLRSAPGEDFGAAVGFDNRTPTSEWISKLSSFNSSILAAVPAAGAVPAMPETTIKTFDPSKQARMMLYMEGIAEAGTWKDVDTIVGCIVYWAEDTANAEHIWRSRGADSIFHAATTLEALPSSITPAMVGAADRTTVGTTGFKVTDLDKDGRFNYFERPYAA